MIITSQTEIKNENFPQNNDFASMNSDRSNTISIESSSNTNQILMIKQTFPIKIKEKPSLPLLDNKDNDAIIKKKNKQVSFKSPLVETIKIVSFKLENLNNCYSDPFGNVPNRISMSKRNSFTNNPTYKRRYFGKMRKMFKGNEFAEKMKMSEFYFRIRRWFDYVLSCVCRK